MQISEVLDPHATSHDLVKLLENEELHPAIATHPNASPQTLAWLANRYPKEVLENPALPLLRLAYPGMFSWWPVMALSAMLRLEDAPEWLLVVCAGDPRVDVQAAVLARRDLPEKVKQVLRRSPFWTIRERVP